MPLLTIDSENANCPRTNIEIRNSNTHLQPAISGSEAQAVVTQSCNKAFLRSPSISYMTRSIYSHRFIHFQLCRAMITYQMRAELFLQTLAEFTELFQVLWGNCLPEGRLPPRPSAFPGLSYSTGGRSGTMVSSQVSCLQRRWRNIRFLIFFMMMEAGREEDFITSGFRAVFLWPLEPGKRLIKQPVFVQVPWGTGET